MSSSYNHSSSSDSDEDELNELLNQSPMEHLVREVQEQRRFLNEMLSESSNAPKKRKYINRDREGAHTRLVNDYFAENSTYGSNIFRRCFRMGKDLFLRIVGALESHDSYFQWRVDAVGRKGFSPLQKCAVAIRQLAYGGPADHYDEYLRVAETTAIDCLFKFCRSVIDVFGPHYLRAPTAADVQRLYRMHEQRHGFPGMLGSLDCMHWEWRNCPVAWKGQYTRGDHGVPTIMFEAVASQDLWIWHAYFGVAGSNNDINVLNQSPLFNDVVLDRAPNMHFVVNGREYTQGYYLTDGIYPEWPTFVKSFQCPHDPKKIKFKEMQEAARKDVERTFGVLQSRWAMIRGPGRFWYKSNLKEIMIACIVLHNMIVEHEGDSMTDWSDEANTSNINNVNNPSIIQGSTEAFNRYLRARAELRDKRKHQQLQMDLIEHIWARHEEN